MIIIIIIIIIIVIIIIIIIKEKRKICRTRDMMPEKERGRENYTYTQIYEYTTL
jgi:hypothetical protein